jgi:hypothetical protein
VARCQRHELLTPAREERIGTDDERTGLLLDEGCAFRRGRRGIAAAGCDHVDLAADEAGGQCRLPIIAALCPAVFDRQVLSLDPAGFAQSSAESSHKRGAYRPGEARPSTGIAFCCARRARVMVAAPAQEQQQLAPPHSMTSSAWVFGSRKETTAISEG